MEKVTQKQYGLDNVYEQIRKEHGWSQPTNEELHAAWTNAINLEGSGAAFSAALQELREIRKNRTTWFNSEENELRRSMDAYLEHFYA